VAPNLEEESWQPKRGGESPVRATVAFIGATSQAMDKLSMAVYCDVVTLLCMWHPGDKRQTPTRSSWPAAGQVGTAASSRPHLRSRSFHRRPLSALERMNRNAGEDHNARPPAVESSLNLILFSHCTITFFIRHSDKANWRALFSIFHVMTY
jgi:hypothetical protein